MLLLLTPSAQAEVLEETTAAAGEAVETVAPTEVGSTPSPELEAETPATVVEEAASEPASAPAEGLEAVAEPVEKTVKSVAAPVETPVSKVVSAVPKTVESASTGPVSSTVKAVEDVGGRLQDASAPAAPQIEPPASSTGSAPATEPNVALPTGAPEAYGSHATLGADASHTTLSMQKVFGAAESLLPILSFAPASDPVRPAADGGRGSDPLPAPGPRPESPAAVGSASGGTSFVPIAALLALLALVAPAIVRRPLEVLSSRAPAELACALERPG